AHAPAHPRTKSRFWSPCIPPSTSCAGVNACPKPLACEGGAACAPHLNRVPTTQAGDKSMKSNRSIDVHKLADEARFNRFHGSVLIWCFMILVLDGYDLAVAGTALPSIMRAMNVDA